jgi:branched-chain amino acid transport system substrate-binding protein
MTMKITSFIITGIGILGLSLGFVGCEKPNKSNNVHIGVIVPLTGGAAEFGRWARNGVELAVAELNEQTNSSGVKILPIFEDHQNDPKIGLSAFKKLVDADKVLAVISSGSGTVLAIAPEAERTHTLQLNHAAVSPAIRKAGRYTFTLVNDADVETDEIAHLAVKTLGIKRLAVLYANTAYGVTTRDSVTRSFTKLSAEILGAVAFSENFTDLRAQILQLKEMNPPAIYFIATIKDSGRLLKQAQELGLKTQWLTYNAFESPEVLQIAGEAAEGVIFTSSNIFDLTNPGPRPARFLKSYLSKYGQRPNLYAATAYDSIHLLAIAAASLDRSKERLQTYFASVKDFEGASGVISFDQNGCVRKPVFLKTVQNGEFRVFEKISKGN